MSIIQAKVLWQNGEVVNCPSDINLNCSQFDLASVRDAWITRRAQCCGKSQTGLTFSNPNDANALHGIWISVRGEGLVIDAADVASVVTACNACCGDPTDVAPVYDGTIPPVTDPAQNLYCVRRADNGGSYAIQNAFLDYQGNYAHMVHKQYLNGVSTYEMQAYKKPVALGTDVVTAGACPALTLEEAANFRLGGTPKTANSKAIPVGASKTAVSAEAGDVDVMDEASQTENSTGIGKDVPVMSFCIKRKDDGSEKAVKAFNKAYGFIGVEPIKNVKGYSYYPVTTAETPVAQDGDEISVGPCA